MTAFSILKKWFLVMFLASVSMCQMQRQLKSTDSGGQDTAEKTLQNYVRLRLSNADWKEYSKFVIWPDEPSWDCNWVVDKYRVGLLRKRIKNIIVPVAYKRLGLFCYDFEFTMEPREVTIDYELISGPRGWKINAPIPDYPDISANVLLRSLRQKAETPQESSERQAQFRAVARKLEVARARSPASHHIKPRI
jgi:hypothetical protein